MTNSKKCSTLKETFEQKFCIRKNSIENKMNVSLFIFIYLDFIVTTASKIYL